MNLERADSFVPEFVFESDRVFDLFIDCLDEAEPQSGVKLAILVQSSLRSSALLSVGGAIHQIPLIHRHALESAIYSLLFHMNTEFEQIWLLREFDENMKKKFRNEGLKKARELLRMRNPVAYDAWDKLYQFTISTGAHPNIGPFELYAEYRNNDKIKSAELLFLQLVSDQQRIPSWWMQVFVTINCLDIFELIWPERFVERGISLKKQHLMESYEIWRDKSKFDANGDLKRPDD